MELGLQDVLELISTDEISTRTYYVYYRLVQGVEEQKAGAFETSYNTMLATLSAVFALIGVVTIFQDVADAVKASVVVGVVLVLLVLYLSKGHFRPAKGKDLDDTIRLAIHLGEINQFARQIRLLLKVKDEPATREMKKALLLERLDYLKKVASEITAVKGALESKDEAQMKQDLDSIHVDMPFVEARIALATSVIREAESGVAP